MIAADPRVQWHLPPDLRSQFVDSSGCLNIQEWLNNGSVDVVKSGSHRAVYRCKPGLDFYLKQYCAYGLRNRSRELLRPVKAKTEFDKASALAKLGINVPRPLGWGVLGSFLAPTASFLLSETVHDTIQLTHIDNEALTPLRRQNLPRELARFFARLHAVGVTHRDIHPGNLLLRWSNDEPSFTLIDLHEVRLHSRLSWRQCRDNLIMLNRYYMLRASRADRLRFWRSYEHAGKVPECSDAMPAAMETATIRSNQSLWQARRDHHVRRIKHKNLKGFYASELDEANVAATLLRNPDALMSGPDVRMLKDGGRSTVVATPLGVVKRINTRSTWERLKNRLRPDPAWRSMCIARLMRAAGLPTPKPLAAWHRPRLGQSFLLNEELTGVVNLREFIDGEPSMRTKRQRVMVVARTLHQFHDSGFTHRDLKAPNILTPIDANDHRVWFVDLAGVRFPRRASRHRRIRDLSRLAASFLSHPRITDGDRLRFLLTYRGLGIRSKAGWQRWWRELGQQGNAIVDDILQRGRSVG